MVVDDHCAQAVALFPGTREGTSETAIEASLDSRMATRKCESDKDRPCAGSERSR